MNTYDYLKTLDLNDIYSLDDNTQILNELISISEILKQYLLLDFERLTIEPKTIEILGVEYDNPYYRQSATGIIYKIHFLNEENFKINIEVLVDFHKILINTKGKAKSIELHDFDSKILSKHNYEFKTDLREIL